MSERTLFDRAGGAEAFRWLIDAFYDRVEADELIGPLFPGGVTEERRAHVAAWWCELFGARPALGLGCRAALRALTR